MKKKDYSGLQNRMASGERNRRDKGSGPGPRMPSGKDLEGRIRSIEIGLYKALSEEAILDNLDISHEHLEGQVIFEIRGAIWEQVFDEVVVSYPIDWWQALKERFFPSWALRRWPVVYEASIMSLSAVYPDLHRNKLFEDERVLFGITRESHLWHEGMEEPGE